LVADAIGHTANLAQPIGEPAGQHLLDHQFRLIEIGRLRQHLGHARAVGGIGHPQPRLDGGAEEGEETVRVSVDPGVGGGDGAAGMVLPDLAGDQVNEAGALEHGALAAGLAAKEAIDVAGAQGSLNTGGSSTPDVLRPRLVDT
jgi:hypothetical protein